MILIILGELSVGVSDLSINTEAKTNWVRLVPGPRRVSEDVLVQCSVLGCGDQCVGVTAPGDVSGHVPVLGKGGEGNKGPLDIPDINCKVDTERAAAEVIRTLRPPLDPPHRTDSVDSVLEAVHLVPLPAHGVPHLDGLVPPRRGEDIPLVRMPVAGEHVVVVGGPLLLTPVRPPSVPQLDLAILRHRAELVIVQRIELHIPH